MLAKLDARKAQKLMSSSGASHQKCVEALMHARGEYAAALAQLKTRTTVDAVPAETPQRSVSDLMREIEDAGTSEQPKGKEKKKARKKGR